MDKLRELDRRVAEEVMGWEVANGRHGSLFFTVGIGNLVYRCISTEEHDDDTSFCPSIRLSDAWIVVERMREIGWPHINMKSEKSYSLAEFCQTSHEADGIAETIPEAICLAALAAVKGASDG